MVHVAGPGRAGYNPMVKSPRWETALHLGPKIHLDCDQLVDTLPFPCTPSQKPCLCNVQLLVSTFGSQQQLAHFLCVHNISYTCMMKLGWFLQLSEHLKSILKTTIVWPYRTNSNQNIVLSSYTWEERYG